MKRSFTRVLASVLMLSLVFGMIPAWAGAAATPSDRVVSSINGAWQFKWQGADTTDLSGAITSGWDTVTVPHSWNATDGSDGGGNYKRGIGWYSKAVEITAEQLLGQVFFECFGASQQADVYVNGTHVGNHKGGYTLFRYDITAALSAGTNRIDVKVDNTNGGTTKTIIAPIVGDFTVYGGIYRDVNLIFTNKIHVDGVGEINTDGGFATAPGSGLYLATSNVSAAQATLDISSKIVNDGAAEKTVKVTAILKQQNTAELDWLSAEIPGLYFDPAIMGDGSVVQQAVDTFTIAAGESASFAKTMTVTNPHLWNGRTDPFRYEVELQVTVDGQVVDTVSDYVGFRSFEVTDNGGFFLNGAPYLLRGVSRHQDKSGKGPALSKEDHNEDFALIYEMGASSIRLAHYPQDPYFYELCDRFGIVVWAEIPFIGGHNVPGTAEANASNELMRQTTKQQLRELILQQFNRPGICFWGLENEVGHQANASLAQGWIADMNDMAHALDPSRLTTLATNVDAAYGWASDLIAWNKYPGWYGGAMDQLGSNMDGAKNNADKRPVGISEYGAGANPSHHEFNTAKTIANAGGQWHPEEFQSDLHEEAIKAIKARNWLWCTYVWNMFDFGSDSRNEGNTPGINDKGLVSFDRTLKKDSFYLYKANWNTLDYFVHLTSARWNPREEVVAPEIKVYSNCDSVTLTVNGTNLGAGTAEGNGVFTWKNVTLALTGDNEVIATGTKNDQMFTDTVIWTRNLSSSTDLSSATLAVNNTGKTIGLTGNYTADGLQTLLSGNNATFALYESNGTTPVTGTAIVMPGMKLIVTAEDGITQATYTFVSMNLSYGRPVMFSSQQVVSGNENPATNAVDFNLDTRWAAGRSFASGVGGEWITVDLEAEYYLTSIDINWYDPTGRAYYYEVQVSFDNVNFITVADRSANTVRGFVHDNLGGVAGRYVRILVKGCSAGTGVNASIYEIGVNGFEIRSDLYGINHLDRVITVLPEHVNGTLDPATFLENIAVAGNCFVKMDDMANYYIVEGDSLLIQVNDGTIIRYAIDMPGGTGPVYGVISTGKRIAFSGEEGTSTDGTEDTHASNINDGTLRTRWAAPQYKNGDPAQGQVTSGTCYYPEWVTIDLGAVYDLKQFDLTFYKHGQNDRAYEYEILVSETGDSFTQIVDQRTNADKSGTYTHTPTARARYVKLNVTGCTNKANYAGASVHEFEIRGVAVLGIAFQADALTMQVNEKATPLYTISPREMRNASATLTSSAPDIVKVQGGSLLALAEGTATITATMDDHPDVIATLPVTVSGIGPLSLGKPITFSAEEGISSDGEDTHASNINDGKLNTRWAAPQYKNGDPAQGQVTSGIRYFPEWVTIDLEGIYDVTELQLLFYKHGENNRAYQYEVLGSVTGAEGSFTRIVDNTSNADKSGSFTHTASAQARYIKLNVTGCDLNVNYACASVYEFSVHGAPIPVTGVSLDKTAITLAVGESETLTAAVLPAGVTDQSVVWTSSDPTIASVTDGVVTGLAVGTTRITATSVSDNTKFAVCDVTVKHGPVLASLRTSAGGDLNSRIDYILSLENMARVMNVRVRFEVDGSMLAGNGLEAIRSDFEAMNGGSGTIRWIEKADDIWEGEFLLMYLGGPDGFTESAATDVVKMLFTALRYGDATVTLTDLLVTGLDENNLGITLDSAITQATATAPIKKIYSKYDLNKDGTVDERDLAMAQRFYQAREGDAGWDAAKVCDFDNNRIVDMLDLLDLFTHFGEY